MSSKCDKVGDKVSDVFPITDTPYQTIERREPVKWTPAELADMAANVIKAEVDDYRKGMASASQDALSEVHKMTKSGLLQTMADDLQKDGSATVIRDKNGNPTHLIFNDKEGGKPIDIDITQDTINNKNEATLHQEAVKQAKEFVHAEFDDKRITDLDGKPISAEARDAAKRLMDAVLDGDKAAMSKVGKEILQNPELAKSVAAAFDSVGPLMGIKFDRDSSGDQHIRFAGTEENFSIDKNGSFEDAHFGGVYDQWDYKPAKNIDQSINNTSNFGLSAIKEDIQRDIDWLEFKHSLPADAERNMQALEEANWTDRLKTRACN